MKSVIELFVDEIFKVTNAFQLILYSVFLSHCLFSHQRVTICSYQSSFTRLCNFRFMYVDVLKFLQLKSP